MKELNGQPLTAADQISSASSEKNVGPSLFELAIRSDGSDEGPALGVCLCMQEASLLPKLSLSAVHRSVFLTCVAPLQNKQRWGKTAPNSLSTPSFPQSLHENRWLWHYQQSQLVSHACSGGGRINWPLPFLQSQWWKGPLFIAACLVLFRGIINIFHRSVIQEKHAFSLLQVVFISKFSNASHTLKMKGVLYKSKPEKSGKWLNGRGEKLCSSKNEWLDGCKLYRESLKNQQCDA